MSGISDETSYEIAHAGDSYVKLCEQKWIPVGENAAVDAFYKELTSRYPEIDTVPEEELYNCPWSCAHDRSGLHVLMAMAWSRCAEIAPVVLDLAAKHGLVCYDPQESKVHLPSQLKPRPSRFRSWWQRLRMVVTGIGFIAIAVLRGSAQELDPHDPFVIAYRLERASAVVVGKFQKDWCACPASRAVGIAAGPFTLQNRYKEAGSRARPCSSAGRSATETPASFAKRSASSTAMRGSIFDEEERWMAINSDRRTFWCGGSFPDGRAQCCRPGRSRSKD